MRRLGLVLGLLVLLAAAPAEGATPLLRHAVPGTGFSIAFPSSWKSVDYREVAQTGVLDRLVRENPTMAPLLQQVGSAGSSIKLLAFDPDVTAGFATNVNVLVFRAPAGATSEQAADATIAQLGRVPNVIGRVARLPLHLPAGPAVRLRLRLRFTIAGRPLVVSTTQYVLVKDGTASAVTYTTLPQLLRSYDRMFAASARSIRLS